MTLGFSGMALVLAMIATVAWAQALVARGGSRLIAAVALTLAGLELMSSGAFLLVDLGLVSRGLEYFVVQRSQSLASGVVLLAGVFAYRRLLAVQRALEKSQARVRAVEESSALGIFTSTFAGKIVQANDAFLRLVGRSREELEEGLDRFAITPPEHHEADRASIVEVREKGASAPYEKEFVHKDGSRVPVLVGRVQFEGDEVVSFVIDLSETRVAQEEQHQTEERFRYLVESTKEYAIYTLDPEGYVTSWNKGAERIKGYAASEIIGQSYACFFTPEDCASGKPARQLAHALESGRFEDRGWRVRKDGTRFLAEVVISAMFDSAGKHSGFAKVTRDMSALAQERRAATDRLSKS